MFEQIVFWVAVLAVFWSIFMLGRLWERDHPRTGKLVFEIEQARRSAVEQIGQMEAKALPYVGVRPAPYDQAKED